ncbi:hypothetical protein BE15_42280 [Sorangium cellulosum]|uniref:Uncharacterized protein n=1 Tax=Sorangium cellulosum TaxID=56 RepID=A0A150PZ55_SORCE|nr:hypothetical protein BE15_42280 [Sorangium cellulosum]
MPEARGGALGTAPGSSSSPAGAMSVIGGTARQRRFPAWPACRPRTRQADGAGLAGVLLFAARGFLAFPATSVVALVSLLRLARSFLAACALRRLIFIDWRRSRLPICFNLLTVGGTGAAS